MKKVTKRKRLRKLTETQLQDILFQTLAASDIEAMYQAFQEYEVQGLIGLEEFISLVIDYIPMDRLQCKINNAINS